MAHETELIATIAIGLSAAFVGGLIAARLGLPTVVGYILAGIAVGPFTPGFVADSGLAQQLAEIGVILLMFGVGMHFSIPDLLAVRRIAIPGGVGQAVGTALVGFAVGRWWGWTTGEALVFGMALSVASTVVLLRALETRGDIRTPAARVAVGWLIVEDILTVLALVLLPLFASSLGGTSDSEGSLWSELLLTLGGLVLFVALMLVVGVRVIPRLLSWTERLGSRELFVLAVLAIGLGIAFGAAELFGVSVALGAFVAGVVLNESDLSHRAAEQALPLQDAFAVLFFVFVGMLIDPAFLVDEVGRVLVVTFLIVVVKAGFALAIVLALRQPLRTGLVVAAGLSQIGEFSFILAAVGRSLGLLTVEAQNLILAGALVTITLNPLLFAAADRAIRAADRRAGRVDERPEPTGPG
jgi:CPA2 family monovalent cation:H+ antiporter-2